jgi:hypothetical protein
MSASKLQLAAGNAIQITCSCSVMVVKSFHGLDTTYLVKATIADQHKILSNEAQELKKLD